MPDGSSVATEFESVNKLKAKESAKVQVGWMFIYLATIPIGILCGVILAYILAVIFFASHTGDEDPIGFSSFLLLTPIGSIAFISILLLLAKTIKVGRTLRTTKILIFLMIVLYVSFFFVLKIHTDLSTKPQISRTSTITYPRPALILFK